MGQGGVGEGGDVAKVPHVASSEVASRAGVLGAQYYASRPVMVTKRTLRLLWAIAQLCSGLGIDYLKGRLYTNSQQRSRQLRIIIERLGPAYVKVRDYPSSQRFDCTNCAHAFRFCSSTAAATCNRDARRPCVHISSGEVAVIQIALECLRLKISTAGRSLSTTWCVFGGAGSPSPVHSCRHP